MRQLTIAVPTEFENVVLEALEGTCQLRNVTRIGDGLSSRLTCYVAAHECGVVLHELDKVGCGTAYGKVALLPVQLLKPLPNFNDRHLSLLVKQSTWSVEGRMATEEIYTTVMSGTELSFDYLAYVVVAGLIAAVGLAVNSSVMIVASMLVSPLMGPILAFAFGTSVQDWFLVKKGLIAEVVGVALTFLVGFVVGLVVCAWTGVATFYHWPTAEMESRGEDSSLLVGVFFALPSGAGVALSTTQGGTNALVGVAIAASLLPPITNTGLCLAFAAAGARRTNMDAGKFYRISGMSFALFAINVACIYLVCILLFWIKKIKKVRRQLSTYRDLPPVLKKGSASSKLSTTPTRQRRSTGGDGTAALGVTGDVTIQISKNTATATTTATTTALGKAGASTSGPDIEMGGLSPAKASGGTALRSSVDGNRPASPASDVGSATAVRTPQSNPSNRRPSDGIRGFKKSVSSRLAGLLGPFLHSQMSRHGSGSSRGLSGGGLSGHAPSSKGGVSAGSTPAGSVRSASRSGKRAAALGRWRRVRKAVLEDGVLRDVDGAVPEEGEAEEDAGGQQPEQKQQV